MIEWKTKTPEFKTHYREKIGCDICLFYPGKIKVSKMQPLILLAQKVG
jgi:hypothetical protein